MVDVLVLHEQDYFAGFEDSGNGGGEVRGQRHQETVVGLVG